ncbi:hypothetical protein [Luteibacter sp. Lutesp34]
MPSSVPPMFADDRSSAALPCSHEAPRADVVRAAEPPDPTGPRNEDR